MQDLPIHRIANKLKYRMGVVYLQPHYNRLSRSFLSDLVTYAIEQAQQSPEPSASCQYLMPPITHSAVIASNSKNPFGKSSCSLAFM